MLLDEGVVDGAVQKHDGVFRKGAENRGTVCVPDGFTDALCS